MADVLDERFKVSEIGAIDISPDVPIAQDRVEAIKAQDDDPMFVTVEIEEGMSRSNRLWEPQVLQSIAQQVNEKLPVAYQGHIKEEDDPFSFPDPKTAWLGARAIKKPDGKVVLRIKGYMLDPEMKRLVKLGAVDGVSVRGDAVLEPLRGGGAKVGEFDLESIDWARKGRSGMKSKVVSVTSEMLEGGNPVEPKDIAALKEAELREHNPLLVESIENKAAEPLQTKVTEQTAAIDAAKPEHDLLVSIREKLGLDEDADVLENLSAIVDRVDGAVRTEVRNFIKEKVADKVKSESGQKLVLRMIGEMSDVKAETGEDGKLDKETQTIIENRLTKAFEEDEDVKAIVTEQISTAPAGGRGLGGQRQKSGYEQNLDRQETDNLAVESVSFGS